MTKKKNTMLKIVSVVFSVVFSIALALSLMTTMLISVGRDYVSSNEFRYKIDNTDLSTMKFVHNGKKITLEKYVKDYVTKNIENHIQNNPLSDFTNILFPIFDSVTDFTVDKALSSDFINKTVKNEVHSIFDYFLYSNVDEAKERIEMGITLDNNVALIPENATTFEERVSAEVKMAVFQYIEEESGMSCDEIIVLISEKTISDLKTLSIILFLSLVIVSIPTFPSLFLFLGIALVIFKSQISSYIVEFKQHFAGNEDLISYQLIKPLIDAYEPHADRGGSTGIILLALFAIALIILYFIKKKK